MEKILIVTGGNSSERRISFMSAVQVKKALIKKGYSVKFFDLKKGFECLKKTASNFDVIFPVLHGEEGEGGVLHKELVKLKKPIVGTRNYKALQKGWYKIPFKIFCEDQKIITPKWKIVKNNIFSGLTTGVFPKEDVFLPEFIPALKRSGFSSGANKEDLLKFGFPCVLKTSNGGSSREVVILKEKKDLNKYTVKKLFDSGHPLFVERYMEGIEVTVAIFDNKALPVIEIVPPENGWFDYKNKYWGKTREIPNAPSLTKSMRKKVQLIALAIHKKLDLGSYSRIDFMISSNTPYALEANTIPGLTSGSLFPKAALAEGISFEDLMDKLVKLAG